MGDHDQWSTGSSGAGPRTLATLSTGHKVVTRGHKETQGGQGSWSQLTSSNVRGWCHHRGPGAGAGAGGRGADI